MGAVTAIMYGDRDPSIAGMVLDSPFSSLKLLVEELVKDRVSLPTFVVNQALKLVKTTVQKKAGFKLDDIEPITYAKRCFIPALFVAAKDDAFVKPHHSKLLHDVYPGDKNLVSIDGDHNSMRPRFFKDSAAIFFYNTLQVQYIKEVSDNYAGFQFSIKKDEDEKIESVPKDSNNIIIESSSNTNTNLTNDNKVNIIENYNEELNIITDKMNFYDLGEDEEEIFKKIIEMSKKEYEEQLSTDKDKEKEKDIDKENISK
jgi:hypothetical protein